MRSSPPLDPPPPGAPRAAAPTGGAGGGLRWVLMAWLVTMVLVGAGCSGAGESATGGASASGGTIRIGDPQLESGGPATLLAPLRQTAYYPSIVGFLLFDGLTRLEPTKDFAPEPALATSWDISPDGRGYTFHLREGVRWHDGAPFTAEDVKFTLDLIRDPKIGATAATDLSEVTTVSVTDPQTVTITLTQPSATLLKVVSLGVLPQHLLGPDIAAGKNPRETAFAQKPVGTGPFVFDTYRIGESLSFTANPGYWAGRARLDQVVLVPGTEEALLARAKAGDLDVTTIPGAQVSSVAGDSRFRVVSYPTTNNQVIALNTHVPELTDPRVRIALNLLVDKQVILTSLTQGKGHINSGPFDATEFALTQDQTFAYNPSQAAQLLTTAGYTRSDTGTWTKNGTPLSITIQDFNPPLAELVVNSWKTNGITATVAQTDSTKLFGTAATNPTSIQATNYNFGSSVDPDGVSLVLNSTSTLNVGGYNIFGYTNPTVDTGLTQGRTTSDPAARQAAYASVQRALADDPPTSGPSPPTRTSSSPPRSPAMTPASPNQPTPSTSTPTSPNGPSELMEGRGTERSLSSFGYFTIAEGATT